jgi:hypothetical protein
VVVIVSLKTEQEAQLSSWNWNVGMKMGMTFWRVKIGEETSSRGLTDVSDGLRTNQNQILSKHPTMMMMMIHHL